MAAVVVTDGSSGSGIEGVSESSQSIRHHGVEMFAVLIGSVIKTEEVKVMASDPYNEHVFPLKESTSIKPVTDKIVKEICKARE